MITPRPCLPGPAIFPAYAYVVDAPWADPLAFRWVVPNEELVSNGQTVGNVQFGEMPRTNVRINGGQINPGDNTHNGQVQSVPTWHHVSIEVDGELAYRVAEFPDGPGAEMNNANRSSMLKARIQVAMGASRVREFDFDIGAGVEFVVRGHWVNWVKALIPDPTQPPPVQPGVIVTDPHALRTVLTTAVYCTTLPTFYKNPLTYSQAFTMGGGVTSWSMPVVADAREVMLTIDTFSPDEVIASIQFEYAFGDVSEPSYGALAVPSIDVGRVTIPINAGTSPVVPIPGQANSMRIVVPGGAPTAIANVVQILNV